MGMTEVKVLVLKSLPNIEIASPFLAKVLACSQAVWLGLAMGVDKLEVEGDALTIIKKRQSIAIDKSKISAYIRDIHHNRRGFQSIHFKHVQRSANIIAHKLASKSLRRNEEIYLEGVVPKYAQKSLGLGHQREREPD
ncbi:hypothetical protein Gogos_011705 [Gossypium gossypioides]|uniref:RNase H type-1 domain-containing protein n=1 Tax=Gossypium gossypioides TaxID=34282 RepID=A0A7J9BQ69_GOSGO|nr:hypothetical protein [Gossypium gossypioides]